MKSQPTLPGSQQIEISTLLQLANRQVLQERMSKESVIKESVRRALLG